MPFLCSECLLFFLIHLRVRLSAFLFLSLSILAFAVGEPAGSCCAPCSLFSRCSRGLRIPDVDAGDVPGIGGAAAGSYQKFCRYVLCGAGALSTSGGRSGDIWRRDSTLNDHC